MVSSAEETVPRYTKRANTCLTWPPFKVNLKRRRGITMVTAGVTHKNSGFGNNIAPGCSADHPAFWAHCPICQDSRHLHLRLSTVGARCQCGRRDGVLLRPWGILGVQKLGFLASVPRVTGLGDLQSRSFIGSFQGVDLIPRNFL
jgi:hypothetical protein